MWSVSLSIRLVLSADRIPKKNKIENFYPRIEIGVIMERKTDYIFFPWKESVIFIICFESFII
jgi:hypothetical protein